MSRPALPGRPPTRARIWSGLGCAYGQGTYLVTGLVRVRIRAAVRIRAGVRIRAAVRIRAGVRVRVRGAVRVRSVVRV